MTKREEAKAKVDAAIANLTPQQRAQLAPVLKAVQDASDLIAQSHDDLKVKLTEQVTKNGKRRAHPALTKALLDLFAAGEIE
jgi:hypothetical protein